MASDSDSDLEPSDRITVAIMLKGESKTITKTLKSCLGIIWRAIILDTGFANDTIQIVLEFCKEHGLSLEVVQCEQTYSGLCRNALLDYTETRVLKDRFYMILDITDELEYSHNFVVEVHALSSTIDLIACEMKQSRRYGESDIMPKTSILIRSGASIRYRGFVHEYLIRNNEDIYNDHHITSAKIFRDCSEENVIANDIKDLECEIVLTKPQGMHLFRIWYYLGHSYFLSRQFHKAIFYYAKLFDKKLEQEVDDLYRSNLEYGIILYVFGQSPEKQLHHFMSAYEIYPNRMELLIYITKVLCAQKRYNNAYLFIRTACEAVQPVALDDITHNELLGLTMLEIYIYTRWILKIIVCNNLERYEESRDALSNISTNFISERHEEEYHSYNKLIHSYFKE